MDVMAYDDLGCFCFFLFFGVVLFIFVHARLLAY